MKNSQIIPHRRLVGQAAGKDGIYHAPPGRDWCQTGRADAGCAGQGV